MVRVFTKDLRIESPSAGEFIRYMENTMKSFLIIAELIPVNNPRFFFRRISSLLITFYISYLFVHFVVLNNFIIDSTLMILVNIWIGHIFLNISTLSITKNMTFGDLLVKIEYQSFRDNIVPLCLVSIRSIITATLFYLFIFCTYLAGFSLSAIMTCLILAIIINLYKVSINATKLSVIDWITGTVAVKGQTKWF